MSMDIAEYVERSRAAQGLPPRITDPEVLRRVATLLAARSETVKAA